MRRKPSARKVNYVLVESSFMDSLVLFLDLSLGLNTRDKLDGVLMGKQALVAVHQGRCARDPMCAQGDHHMSHSAFLGCQKALYEMN